MKTFCGFAGLFVGMFVGFIFLNSVPQLSFICIVGGMPLGRYIGGQIEESQEQERAALEKLYKERVARERENIKKKERRGKAVSLSEKYPEAIKYYFKTHWGLNKSTISQYDITDDKVDTLLSHSEYEYQRKEEELNAAYKAKIEAQKEAERLRQEAKRKAEREEAERKRREEELARQQEEEEKRNLVTTLPACVDSWETHGSSSLKHKYYYDYYTYSVYKGDATQSMWNTWKTVWNFKNDPSKGVSIYEHGVALQKVIRLVEETIRSTFGSKTKYLTLVCLTASTQRKTELRFKDFAETVCSDLHMTNAYPHIRVVEDGSAKHDGGDGSRKVSYDSYFFKGKYVILFDDVRTSGHSLEAERRIMENFGATVICAITIAQTTH